MSYAIMVCFFARKVVGDESQAIMDAEGIDVSHAGNVFLDGDSALKVHHCDDPGVLIEALADVLKERVIKHAFRVPMRCDRASFCEHVYERAHPDPFDPNKKIPYADEQLYVNQPLRLAEVPLTPIRNQDAETICCEESYIDLRLSKLSSNMPFDQDRMGLAEYLTWLNALAAAGKVDKLKPEEFPK